VSDDGETYDQRVNARLRQEAQEFEQDERAKRQQLLDFWWQWNLDMKAAARHSERRGDYNPIARFMREQKDEHGW
jgi:hypothetical protein